MMSIYMIILVFLFEAYLQQYNICLKQLSAISCKLMRSGYSMNCYRIVTEINKKDAADNLFQFEETGDTFICPQFPNQFIALLIAGDKSSS